MQYDTCNCQQLAEEAQRVSAHAAKPRELRTVKRLRTAVVTTGAIVVFWPAAFFVRGDKLNQPVTRTRDTDIL